jgi:hypothetical protein
MQVSLTEQSREAERADFVGKVVLVGITRLNAEGEAVAQLQYHGRITSFTDDGIQIGTAAGKTMTLPPAVDCLQAAPPGEYREHATGGVVTNPDLVSMWEIREASEPGADPSWSFKRINFPPSADSSSAS